MSYSPFARFRNFTKDNLEALLAIYPDMYKEMSWTEAKEVISDVQSDYKRTAYQQACQFGIENRGDDTFSIQHYLYTLNDQGLEKYLNFWFKLYYAPNPYIKADIDDVPSIIYCEIAKRILSSDRLSINYNVYFNEVFGAGSSDILLNAINAYGNPIKLKRDNGITTLYVEESDVEELKNDVERIERLFPIGNSVSKKEFFNRFGLKNFQEYYQLNDYDSFIKSNDYKENISVALEKELSDPSLENKDWIFLCLNRMKEFGVFNDDVLNKLTNLEYCNNKFKLKYTPVITKEITDDADRRIYTPDKFTLNSENEFWVSKEWYSDNSIEDINIVRRNYNRNIFTNWVLKKLKAKIKGLDYKTTVPIKYPLNRIIFGAPGTGKSHLLNKEQRELLGTGNESWERVTFHPDYTYANFVGTYKPTPAKNDEGKDIITYEYVPGPFVRMLVKALNDTNHAHLLLVEEINRANVAAVFGDVFQLLDRNKDGVSEYKVQTSEDLRKYLADKLEVDIEDVANIQLPNNLYIWATMNSADQGVYPMDTAFKRRWDFEYIDIDNDEEKIADYNFTVNGTTINWNALRKAINKQLTEIGINEDKLMGAFFIAKYIIDENNDEKFIDTFCNKVIMYLFEDAARQKSNRIFNLGNGKARYSMLCNDFRKKGLNIFVDAVKSEYERLTNQEGAQG